MVKGGDGDDTLGGGKGNDRLKGEAGADIVNCGPGYDVACKQGPDTIAANCEKVKIV
ncbi:MAG: hypothetical protein ACR2G3_07580 [Solirubrobacterales bacterium]